jgi:hypothetical protein
MILSNVPTDDQASRGRQTKRRSEHMPMNRIQFQQGMSLPELMASFGTKEQCAEAVRHALRQCGALRGAVTT